MFNRRGSHGDRDGESRGHQSGDQVGRPAQPPEGWPQSATEHPAVPESPSHVRRGIAQYATLVTTPMPYDVEASHDPVIVCASGAESDVYKMQSLLSEVLENLGREASARGCVAVYGIQHTLAVQAGTIYITAIGTGARPRVDMDGPPTGH
jgi:hypothetical protein